MKKILSLFACLSFFVPVLHAQEWLLTGNSGTNPSTNFLGTTDSVSFTIKVNNKKAGYIDCEYLKANTSFGS